MKHPHWGRGRALRWLWPFPVTSNPTQGCGAPRASNFFSSPRHPGPRRVPGRPRKRSRICALGAGESVGRRAAPSGPASPIRSTNRRPRPPPPHVRGGAARRLRHRLRSVPAPPRPAPSAAPSPAPPPRSFSAALGVQPPRSGSRSAPGQAAEPQLPSSRGHGEARGAGVPGTQRSGAAGQTDTRNRLPGRRRQRPWRSRSGTPCAALHAGVVLPLLPGWSFQVTSPRARAGRRAGAGRSVAGGRLGRAGWDRLRDASGVGEESRVEDERLDPRRGLPPRPPLPSASSGSRLPAAAAARRHPGRRRLAVFSSWAATARALAERLGPGPVTEWCKVF